MRQLTGHDEIAFHAAGGPGGRHRRLAVLVGEMGLRDPATLSALPLAEWEELLLDLLVAIGGSRIDAETQCPECGVGNSLIFPVRELPRDPVPPPSFGGRPLLLTLADLLALEDAGIDGEAALAMLFARAAGIDTDRAVHDLAGPEREGIITALETAAAGLGVEIATACTECGQAMTLPLDVGEYLDADLRGRVASLLDEIHLIAMSYHWSEAEILSLPRDRRQDYLRRILASGTVAGGGLLAGGG